MEENKLDFNSDKTLRIDTTELQTVINEKKVKKHWYDPIVNFFKRLFKK